MVLHILDTSNYIYAGTYSRRMVCRGVRESSGEYEANEAPIGGVQFLFKEILALLSYEGHTVMPVFDKTPTNKREMYSEVLGDPYGYKGTRDNPIRNDVCLQREFAQICCEKAGLCYQAIDGYEADDVIYTLCKIFHDDYEKIVVHTRDSDLTFLVDDNISIGTVGSKGKWIDMSNYVSLAITNDVCTYDTIHINKLVTGDTADNIPGIGRQWVDPMNYYYNDVLGGDSTGVFRKLHDLDYCRKTLMEIVDRNSTLDNASYVLPCFNLLMPLLCPYEEIDNSESFINVPMLKYFAYGFNQEYDKYDFEPYVLDYIDKFFD